MTSQNCAYSEDVQEVFDYLRYEGKAREVGRGLMYWGYDTLLKDGFPDDPEIIKRYFYGQWESEKEAVKAFAEKLNMNEDFIQKNWSWIKESGRLIVRHLEDGGVLIYEHSH